MSNITNIITAVVDKPVKISDIDPKTNAEYIEANRSSLELDQEIFLPDFPEYAEYRERAGLTKMLRFSKYHSVFMADDVKEWLLDKISEGISFQTVGILEKYLRHACNYVWDMHPEIVSADDVPNTVIDEINENNPVLSHFSEIKRIRNVFRNFVEDIKEKRLLRTVEWTPELEMKRRRWRLDKLGIAYNINPTRKRDTISFEDIRQEWLFNVLAKYIYYRLPIVKIETINSEIQAFEILSEAIELYQMDITSLEQLTEQDGIDIICHIGSKGYGPSTRDSRINALINFFGIAYTIGLIEKDMTGIFSTYRPSKKITRDPEIYSESEILRIIGTLKYLPDNVARAAYILISVGLRSVDVLMMKCEDTIIENSYGDPFIRTVQPKTGKLIEVPCYDHVTVDMFNAAVRKSRDDFGFDCVYAFAKSKTEPLSYDYVREQFIDTLREHDVRDDNGKPIKLLLHQFRRTKASTYINISKFPPEIAAKLLGQSNTRSLGHYVCVTEHQFRDAAQPVFSYFNNLIGNRGNIKEAEMCRQGAVFRLKDGFCLRPLNAGICEKIGGCWACRFFTAIAVDLPYFKIQLEGLKLNLEQARKNGFDLIAEQMEEKIHNLEKIIAGIELGKAR